VQAFHIGRLERTAGTPAYAITAMEEWRWS
jgi:hypothetical protein